MAPGIIIRRIACGLLVFQAAWAAAADPPYLVTVWQADQGLPQSSVTAIAQTSDGYLWLGTQNGLVRFDGVRFQVFDENNTPAIRNSRIVQIFEDRQHALWVGTEHGGLICLRDGVFTSYEVPSRGTTHNYARVLCDDGEQNLWQASCEYQLIRFADGKFSVASTGWPLAGQRVNGLACDCRGKVWVGTENELGSCQNGRFLPAWNQTNEPNFQVDYLAASRDGGVWVAGNGKLRKFANGRWVTDLGTYAWTNRPIYALYEDTQNRLWVGTLGDGLFRYGAEGPPLHLTVQDGLPTGFIRCVLEDREGNLWVGTEGSGLCRLRPSFVQTYGVKQGLASDQVMSVSEARDGGMWIGSDGNGLDHWKAGRVQHYGFDAGLKNGHVWSVVEDRRGHVWAGTWDGLYGLEGANFRGLSDGQTIGWQVLAISEDSAGSLWVGQQAFAGITRLRGEERTVFKIPGTTANLDVRAILEDSSHHLWIGTSDDGLYRMKDGACEHYGRKEGLGSSAVWCLYADAAGVLWIGTCRGGLSRWQNGQLTTWTTQQGLINNVICQILEDDHGNLWFGSYGGIFRVSKEELNRSVSDSSVALHCVAYDREDGLPSIECQGGFQPSGCRSRDGRLWFPTVKGLVVVDPARAQRSALPPSVLIEAVIPDRSAAGTNAATRGPSARPLRPDERLELPAGNRRIEFQYTAFSYSAPNAVRFKYRLEGLEKEWEEAGSKRTAVYSRVPPGTYRFRVLARNGDGIWNENGAAVSITLQPYFWETRWFLVLLLVGVLAAGGTMARHFERRRLRRRLEQVERERTVEKERARIAKDIHDDLGAHLTEIALLSEFAQDPAASREQVMADIQKITVRSRSLTRTMDEIVWAVNPKNDTLERFVTYTCSFAEDYLQSAKIACRMEVPEFLPDIPLTAELRHNLFLAVKEALNNVVKHAAASEARFSVAFESGRLVITIQDNGRGFEVRIQDNIQGGLQQDGLQNMRKRIESMGGRFELQSQPGQGTRLRFMIAIDNPAPRPDIIPGLPGELSAESSPAQDRA